MVSKGFSNLKGVSMEFKGIINSSKAGNHGKVRDLKKLQNSWNSYRTSEHFQNK